MSRFKNVDERSAEDEERREEIKGEKQFERDREKVVMNESNEISKQAVEAAYGFWTADHYNTRVLQQRIQQAINSATSELQQENERLKVECDTWNNSYHEANSERLRLKQKLESGTAVTKTVWATHEQQFAELIKERDSLRQQVEELKKVTSPLP